MNWFVLLCVFAYILIGIFIATLFTRITDDDSSNNFAICMFLWPIVIAGLILFGIIALPYKLANWLCDVIKR